MQKFREWYPALDRPARSLKKAVKQAFYRARGWQVKDDAIFVPFDLHRDLASAEKQELTELRRRVR